MIKALKGEKYSRTASVKDGVVTIKHVSQLADGNHYMTTKVDMSNLDGDEVLRHAAYNVLIQILRPRALKPFKSNEIDETKIYDPTDYPAKRGGGIDKREASIRTLESIGLNREQAEMVLDNPSKAKEVLVKIVNK